MQFRIIFIVDFQHFFFLCKIGLNLIGLNFTQILHIIGLQGLNKSASKESHEGKILVIDKMHITKNLKASRNLSKILQIQSI